MDYRYLNPIDLKLESVQANFISYAFEQDDTVFTVKGKSSIVLKNNSDKVLPLYYYWRKRLNTHQTTDVYIEHNGNRGDYLPYFVCQNNLKPGDTISFNTYDMNVDEHAIEWVFKGVRFI